MQIQNLQIFNYSTADASHNGPWIDISNLVSFSVHILNFGSAGLQVSNDPNVNIDGAAIGPPASAPVLSQFAAGTGFASGVSMLAAQNFFVKTTFVTKWGETTASSESSLVVTAGNYLFVAAPVPSAAQAPSVIGWNVYVGLSTGTEVLQNGNQFDPQRLVDQYGTVGGTPAAPTGTSSTRFAITGAMPLQQNFSMSNGFRQTQWVPPASDASGGVNAGISVGSLAATDSPIAIFNDGTNLMWSPSSMTWKWIRVVGGGATTVAYLTGQKG
jgi:hypothetical protein